MPVAVGREAPDFTLKNPDGEDVTLSDFRGKKNVVLLFYPAAFSGVCSAQFSTVGKTEATYAGEGAQVIGVSVDNLSSAGAFAMAMGLKDTILLADFHPKGEVAKAYGVYLPAAGVSGRATFVIDREGVVRYRALTRTPAELIEQDAYFSEALPACRR